MGTSAAIMLLGLAAAVAAPKPRPSTPAPARSPARAQTPGAAGPPASYAVSDKIALFRLDSLGMPPDIVARLEGLLRVEMERLFQRPTPSRGDIERAVAKDAVLRGCTGEPGCLAQIGKRLGMDLVIAGNVGGLGDSYIVNMKLVNAATGLERNRIRVPLEGNADALIEAVRVALVNLVTPERVRGSLAILVDVKGARISLDGRHIGVTPLKNPVIANLDARPEEKNGKRQNLHTVRISADGYIDYVKPDIEVRFQKTTEVAVHLEERPIVTANGSELPPVHRDRRPFYTRWWFYAAVGAGAVLTGAIIGSSLAHNAVRDCDAPGTMGCQ